MAITIQTEPQDFNPASNPCVFTFSSSSTGQDNFSFIVRLTVNGSVHSFHQVFPESSNYGRFDASEIMRSYVQSELQQSGAVELDVSGMTAEYSISVREKYGDPPTEQGSFVNSNTLTVINGSLRHVDWTNYDYTDYRITTSGLGTPSQPFLTNFPSSATRYCGINESQFLGTICEDSTADATITLRDSSGSTVASVTHSLTVPSSDFLLIDVSPQTLVDDTTLTQTNFDNSYDYTVKVVPTGGGGASSTTDTITVIIDRDCNLYTAKRLHWLNKFGVWESFSFKLYSEENTSVNTKSFQRSLGEWNSSNEWVYNRYRGEDTAIIKNAEDTLTLNSDWIKEDVQQWLSRSLYESPRVYLEVSEGVFEPVRVMKSNYKQKKRVREGLIQENVQVMRTYKYQSQIN